MTIGRPPVPIAERLKAKTVLDEQTGCWLWTGQIGRRGYGQIGSGSDGRTLLTHRVSYELNVGPIPEGLTLDHLCRVRHCINPAHLEPVTARENILRGETLAAANIAKTHCPQGHPYSPENTYIYKGSRSCRICSRAKSARHARVRKERQEAAA